MFQKIQNIIAITMALVTGTTMWLITRFPGRMSFFIFVPICCFFLILGELFLKKIKQSKQTVLPLLLITVFSFFSFVSVIEWDFLYLPLAILSALTVLLLFQSTVAADDNMLKIQQKPYRRIMVSIWSFDIYQLLTVIFAVNLFFPQVPFWVLTLLGGAMFGVASFMIWKMYFQLTASVSLVWVSLISFLMVELVWITHLLPFGYFVSSFLVTWIWYILQLLIRFHFGPNDVMWKKQIGFLATNVVLYVVLLAFFVRWV